MGKHQINLIIDNKAINQNMSYKEPYHRSLARLVQVMDELRDKCPWDKKQTIHTLRTQSIEELYELADAITEENWKGIKEELGDILLHIVFYAKIGKEQGKFDLGDVIESVCNKLVARHPHIYDSVQVKDEQEVKQNWEKLKLKEGRQSVLSGVPNALPAIVKAWRLQDKAKQVGFEWDTKEQVYEKVEEELSELQEAIAQNSQESIEDEFGDVLFSLVNYSRFLNIDPEKALDKNNRKFMSRFQQVETMAANKGQLLHELTLQEMDQLWEEAKKGNTTKGLPLN
jgi:MazG family protein